MDGCGGVLAAPVLEDVPQLTTKQLLVRAPTVSMQASTRFQPPEPWKKGRTSPLSNKKPCLCRESLSVAGILLSWLGPGPAG